MTLLPLNTTADTSVSEMIRKAAARRSPKFIRKTRNRFCGMRVSDPLPKFCENCFLTKNFAEVGQSAAEL